MNSYAARLMRQKNMLNIHCKFSAQQNDVIRREKAGWLKTSEQIKQTNKKKGNIIRADKPNFYTIHILRKCLHHSWLVLSPSQVLKSMFFVLKKLNHPIALSSFRVEGKKSILFILWYILPINQFELVLSVSFSKVLSSFIFFFLSGFLFPSILMHRQKRKKVSHDFIICTNSNQCFNMSFHHIWNVIMWVWGPLCQFIINT